MPDKTKQQRVLKFFEYLDKISKSKGVPIGTIIEKNLRTFDFNLQSGQCLMHPLHYAVEANNIRAVEKLKKAMTSEHVDFFARDGNDLELAQEYAAPTAAIYKIVMRIQFNILTRQFVSLKMEHEKATTPQ